MSILNDVLIDAKADLCWNHQQEQLKSESKLDCICHKLADMIYLTCQEVAKDIESISVIGISDEDEERVRNIIKYCANVARGKSESQA